MELDHFYVISPTLSIASRIHGSTRNLTTSTQLDARDDKRVDVKMADFDEETILKWNTDSEPTLLKHYWNRRAAFNNERSFVNAQHSRRSRFTEQGSKKLQSRLRRAQRGKVDMLLPPFSFFFFSFFLISMLPPFFPFPIKYMSVDRENRREINERERMERGAWNLARRKRGQSGNQIPQFN